MAKLTKKKVASWGAKCEDCSEIEKKVTALCEILGDLYGSEKLVLRASKMGILEALQSQDIEDRVHALQKLVLGNPTLAKKFTFQKIPSVLATIEEELAQMAARKIVEEEIEKKIIEKMQERQDQYLKDMKMQVLKEKGGPENAATLKKLAYLEKLDYVHLNASVIEILRPRSPQEIIGQERAVRSLIAKLSAPFPQHILLYGPPGVGKTSAARIALQYVKKLKNGPFSDDAPFIEVDGTTLRWDPREATNPLLGSVHDPIYQGARRDLAETGVPEPKLGLVTEAHGGILFIDEIGDLDTILQNKLLKVLEDKKVIFESSYYDPDEAQVPQYIKKIFEDGANADFVLIGATTKTPEEINPAFRSRCAEIFFEALSPLAIQDVVRQAAARLKVTLAPGVPELISEYTIEARKATNILVDAHAFAYYKQRKKRGRKKLLEVTCADVQEVLQVSRLIPQVTQKASDSWETGKIFGLAVSGYLGSIIEIEAITFPTREQGKGGVRFNDAAGVMTKDSVFNALAVLRRLTGKEASDYDLHVNIVGGGMVEGPSAGAAVFLALYSSLQGIPLRQDVAITGELSIQGKVRAVGQVPEKVYGARQAGIKKVLIPMENMRDLPQNFGDIEVIGLEKIEEAFPHILGTKAGVCDK